MTESLQKLTLGSALAAPQRQQFVDWLKGNTTGNHRIRAAMRYRAHRLGWRSSAPAPSGPDGTWYRR
nr:hypothetical protein [Klebsiella aerogenes]